VRIWRFGCLVWVDILALRYQTLQSGFKSAFVPSTQPMGLSRMCSSMSTRWCVAFFLVASFVLPASARDKDVLAYGEGLITNIPLPFDEVSQAVAEVAGNGIIRGTKEYNKDEYVKGAEAAASTSAFSPWKDPGKVFYKVRFHALDPWNFKDATDVGTLAVRYVVQPQGEKNSVLRIDAIFVEDDRHSAHQSNGSVENSEYKDIQDHLAATELMKKETTEALQAKEEHATRKDFGLSNDTELLSTPPAGESSSRDNLVGSDLPSRSPDSIASYDPNETPEQHLAALKKQVERTIKNPGAPLKSAPFHSASTLRALNPGTEVLIVIVTPYWLGVETHEGDHGWVRRDELEALP
jgi:hypothetical protein